MAQDKALTVTVHLIEDPVDSAQAAALKNDPTQTELFNLVEGLKRVQSEQQFLMQREMEHKEGSDLL
jgi:hypothetical protein